VTGGFAGAALTLAAFGLYGLLMVLVSSRGKEIGVRLALGATPARVALVILRESLLSTAVGTLLGGGLALLTGRLLGALLVDVSASDPLTIVLVAAGLFSVAALAAVTPASRAARIDPVQALRAD
jgi:putative ABC transport system permease protein